MSGSRLSRLSGLLAGGALLLLCALFVVGRPWGAAELSGMAFDSDTGESFRITFSAGIAVTPGDGDSVEELLKTADARLYRAKANGRNRIET